MYSLCRENVALKSQVWGSLTLAQLCTCTFHPHTPSHVPNTLTPSQMCTHTFHPHTPSHTHTRRCGHIHLYSLYHIPSCPHTSHILPSPHPLTPSHSQMCTHTLYRIPSHPHTSHLLPSPHPLTPSHSQMCTLAFHLYIPSHPHTPTQVLLSQLHASTPTAAHAQMGQIQLGGHTLPSFITLSPGTGDDYVHVSVNQLVLSVY